MPRAHLILVGGFLGAGKTTAIRRLADHLTEQGIRAAVITNDQGSDLVDTRLLASCGVATAEVSGGCFCCQFDQLVDASRRLGAVLRPDVFIAEAVGSCTDLVRTVAHPLRRLHGDAFTVAPVSVLVDPHRARALLDLDPDRGLSDNVRYICRTQLAEAEVLVINKSETLSSPALEELQVALALAFPTARQLVISAREDRGLAAWYREVLFGETRAVPELEVDYDRYADGEARLGWLNLSAEIAAAAPFDLDALLLAAGRRIARDLRQHEVEVAHLKAMLSAPGAVALLNQVRGDAEPEISLAAASRDTTARMTVNLRAEGDPALLERIARTAIEIAATAAAASVRELHRDAFRPGRPTPSHRDGAA